MDGFKAETPANWELPDYILSANLSQCLLPPSEHRFPIAPSCSHHSAMVGLNVVYPRRWNKQMYKMCSSWHTFTETQTHTHNSSFICVINYSSSTMLTCTVPLHDPPTLASFTLPLYAIHVWTGLRNMSRSVTYFLFFRIIFSWYSQCISIVQRLTSVLDQWDLGWNPHSAVRLSGFLSIMYNTNTRLWGFPCASA